MFSDKFVGGEERLAVWSPLVCTKKSRCSKNGVVLSRGTCTTQEVSSGPVLYYLPEEDFQSSVADITCSFFPVHNGEKSFMVENKMQLPVPLSTHTRRHSELATLVILPSMRRKKQYMILRVSLPPSLPFSLSLSFSVSSLPPPPLSLFLFFSAFSPSPSPFSSPSL